MGKKIGAGQFVDDAKIETVLGMSADITVTNEELGECIEILGDGFEDLVEFEGFERLVKVVPVDRVCRDLIFDDIPVFRASTGEGAGLDHEGAGVVEDTFLTAEGMADEFMRR